MTPSKQSQDGTQGLMTVSKQSQDGTQGLMTVSKQSQDGTQGLMTVSKQSQDGNALQFHSDSAWKRSPKTCMKLTNAECTVENS